jgi:hypothetical protein
MEFAGLMTKLVLAYRQRPDASRFEVYYESLKDLWAPLLGRAVDTQIQTNPRFPRIAELRATVKALTPAPRPEPWRPQIPDGPRADPRHAASSFALIRRMTRERLSPAARLQEFERMHREFPQHGWDAAADETRPLVALAAYRAQQAQEEDC